MTDFWTEGFPLILLVVISYLIGYAEGRKDKNHD